MPRGGWRWGAGRPASKLREDHARSVDVRRWQRDGLLRPGGFGWQWTDPTTGEERASIGVQVGGAFLRLQYNADGRAVDERVALETTACHFGGSRHWFRCPGCLRRCALLYLRGGRFRCRLCQRIAYRSQSVDLTGRAWIKQAKAEAKLGGSWSRPRGMHRRTHERLLQTIHACEDMREEALAVIFARLRLIG